MVTKADLESARQMLRDKSKDADGWMGGCTRYLQRKMQSGYTFAASMIEQLEREGFISEPNFVGKRRLLDSHPPEKRKHHDTSRHK